MRVGYFGGSFDPPHRGHLAVACAARDAFGLDRVLLAPTGRQPFKPGGATASFDDRLRMTALLCEGERGLEVSAVDAPQAEDRANYTVETLRRLRAELPEQAALFGIVGADAFLHLPHWREAEALFGLAEWVVVSRPGFEQTSVRRLPLTAAQWTRVHWLGGVAEPVSATALRERLRRDMQCGDLIPEPVLHYVRGHRLYGS